MALGKDSVPEEPELDPNGPERYRARGSQVDGFRLVRILSSGSHGTIYAAKDLETGEAVAIKEAPAKEGGDGGPAASSQSTAGALTREAEVLSVLRHPNVVQLKQACFEDGKAYLVLEHLEGLDLETSLLKAGRPLDESAVQAILLPLIEAVDHIHGAGFLHQDLKPGNIGFRRNGEPVIVDFGASRNYGVPGAGRSPWSYVTAGYAPPERYLEDGAEGPWSDIYALGAIAYRAIAGKAPPAATDRLVTETKTPAVEIGKGRCSTSFLQAVDWALELDPAARPQSAEAWKHALTASLCETPMPKQTEPDGAPDDPHDAYPPTEKVERRPYADIQRSHHAAAERPRAQVTAKRRFGAWIWLVLVAVMAGAATAGWFGWPLYQRYFKHTWIVDASGGGDTDKIAEAIARAPDNATILVRPGLYAESLVVDRPLHLMPAETDGEAPVIAPPEGPCLVVRARTGSVVGLRLQGPGPAVTQPPAMVPCIDIVASGVLIEGNRILNPSGPAIRIRGGAEPTILGNSITGTGGAGILISSGARGTVVDNRIQGAEKSGIVVADGAKPRVVGNVIEDSGEAGVLFAKASAGEFEDNVIKSSKASGIEVRAMADPVVTGNRIESAGQAGIFVYDLGMGRFQLNELVASGYSGLVIASGGAPRFTANVIRGSKEHGILAIGPSGGTLSNNTIIDNKGHGIALAKEATVELGTNNLGENMEPQILEGWAPRPRN